MTLDLYTLERGFELEPFRFAVSRAEVAAYLEATGAPTDDWRDAVPPLALGALTFAGLLERLPLPDGSVHVGQDFEFRRAVPPGAELEAHVSLAQSQERRGSLVSVLEMVLVEADDPAAGPVITGRATVLSPVRAAAANVPL